MLDKLLLGPGSEATSDNEDGVNSQIWATAPFLELLGLPWALMQTCEAPAQAESWNRTKTRCLRLAAQGGDQLGAGAELAGERFLKAACRDEEPRVRACAATIASQLVAHWGLRAATEAAAGIG